MNVREMIKALEALNNPDALVVREVKGYDRMRIYQEMGDFWDIVSVKQCNGGSQWFGAPYEKEEGYTIKLAVVL